MKHEFVVVEHYPQGGTWKHYFYTRRSAQGAMEQLIEAHPGRRYELLPM